MRSERAKTMLRCAVYTRVSTEHGLEQEFNSLDHQREASEDRWKRGRLAHPNSPRLRTRALRYHLHKRRRRPRWADRHRARTPEAEHIS
jgi:hypothetical protein